MSLARKSAMRGWHISGHLAALKLLALCDTAVTDAGIQHLGSLKNLERLNLANTAITDAGLAAIAGLANIIDLDVSGTRVSDAGLNHLKGMQKLTSLRVADSGVTQAGAATLKSVLPNVTVTGASLHRKLPEQGAAIGRCPPLAIRQLGIRIRDRLRRRTPSRNTWKCSPTKPTSKSEAR